jgi:isopentenyl diphosphate isomerase/L-lactate dehydrogenase-like FMN-dependent dehydrogenase
VFKRSTDIALAVGDKAYIMFGSGIRGAADVFKALALGAKFVFVRRRWVWGLSIKGEIGVRHMVKSLLADFDILMNVTGFQSVDQITREHIKSSPISPSMIVEKSKI